MLPVVLVGLFLGGCGGDDDASDGPRSSARTDSAATAPDSTRPSRRPGAGGRPETRPPAPPRTEAVPGSGEPERPSAPAYGGSPSVKTRAWAATATLQLIRRRGRVYTYRGPVSGALPGRVRARLTLQGASASGSFVAGLPGGTIEGTLSVVSSLVRGQPKYSGTATADRGTGRYARLNPTGLEVNGHSSPGGITMNIVGSLRY